MSKLYGIDLDGVCFDFAKSFALWLKDAGVKMPEQKEVTSYYWDECVEGLTRKKFWSEFHRFGETARGYRYLEQIDGALDGLNKIIDKGNSIVFITNRPTYARQDTIESLKENGFPDAELIFAEGKKHPIVNELGVDVFIDDSPDTVKQLFEHTDAKVYCYDYPFNKLLSGPFERVKNWNEFLSMEGI